jgi:serine/threonine protein kinase
VSYMKSRHDCAANLPFYNFPWHASWQTMDSMQFLVHIARQLEILHSVHWVHRDLKPSNTIWLPSQNKWSLIDFGCACQTGQPAELSFSVYYAPPEVIQAYARRDATIIADPSADVWALGVRCFVLCIVVGSSAM